MSDTERQMLHDAACLLRRVTFESDGEYLAKRSQEVADELDEILDAECKPKAESLNLPW